MPQAGTFGLNFDEIMAIATVITVLLVIVPLFSNSNGVNILEIPSLTIKSFNNLWFDDFRVFKTDSKSCVGAIEGVNATNSVAIATPFNYTMDENTTELDKLIYRARLSMGIWKTGPTVSNTPMRTTVEILESTNPVQAFINIITSLLWLVWNLIFTCGFGLIRVVIGLAIASYWFLKTIPLWQLLWNMFMALIG